MEKLKAKRGELIYSPLLLVEVEIELRSRSEPLSYYDSHCPIYLLIFPFKRVWHVSVCQALLQALGKSS